MYFKQVENKYNLKLVVNILQNQQGVALGRIHFGLTSMITFIGCFSM